ncbi:MAG: DUF262 domain-containing HNH endonuclease family protein [Pseudomonadota bacterium]
MPRAPSSRRKLLTDERLIGDVFAGGNRFSLPEFQREFAWTISEAEDLLEDIDTARVDDGADDEAITYFLGTMLFATEPGAASDHQDAATRELRIIDGQQRLTTLTILFAVLRDLETDEVLRGRLAEAIEVAGTQSVAPGSKAGSERPYRMTPRSSDCTFLAARVQSSGSAIRDWSGDPIDPRKSSHQRIDDVRIYFLHQLTTHMTADDRRAFALFLLNSCRIIEMQTDNLDYAYQIFLRLNSRGLPLSDDDIVIAEVIGPLPRAEQEHFQPILDQMQRYREAQEKARSRGKTFFSHLVALHGWSSGAMISDLRRAVKSQGGPSQFTERVFRPMARAYLLTRCAFDDKALPESVKEQLRWLYLLEQMCDDEWVGCAMLLLSNLQADDPRLLRGLIELDRFAHAQLLIRPLRRERRKHYRKCARAIEAAGPDVDPLEIFTLSETEQQRVLRNLALKLHETTNRTAKAVLLRLDAEISRRPATWYLEHCGNDHGGEVQFSIEHILPRGRTLPQSSLWCMEFPDDDERMVYASCLGNLLLISREQNKRAGQKDWLRKRDGFLADPETAQFAMVGDVARRNVWDREAITARYNASMQQLADLWDLTGLLPTLGELKAANLKGQPSPLMGRQINGTRRR